jgi:RimJ/RimL family protein N-acetyltransferase
MKMENSLPIKISRVSGNSLERVLNIFSDDTSNQVSKPDAAWIKYVSTSPNVLVFIVSDETEDYGVVQFDIEEDCAYVSVFIAEHRRGRGLFSPTLSGCIKLLSTSVTKVVANIEKHNVVSIKAFSQFGFVGSPTPNGDDMVVLEFEKFGK